MLRIKILILFLMFYSTAINSQIEFKEYDLENGLHVILHQDKTNPIVCLDIWYHVGAKDEDSARTGFAHLFEHMMFQGSQNVGKAEHFAYIQKAGGTLNGTTNQDRTNYFETVPSNQLELLLWLESDRMSTLKVNQENFDNQREVVKEEKLQRYDNVPYGTRLIKLMDLSFTGQTYQSTAIGSMDDLNNADLSYAQKFYTKYYSPDNAVLVLAGDFEYDNAIKLIKKYFGSLKPANTTKNKYREIFFNQGEKTETVYDNIQLPAVFIGYKVPGITSNEMLSLEILSMILGDGKSSRLYKELVYSSKAAKSAGSFLMDNELAGLFIIYAMGMKNTPTEILNEKITEAVNNITNGNITDYEIEKAMNTIENDHIKSMQTVLGKANTLAHYYTFFKNTGKINEIIDKYRDVTKQDLLDAAKKYLLKENRVVLTYLPKINNGNN